MSAKAAVLMYHAVSDETLDTSAADPHYTVGAHAFDQQLDAIAERGLRVAHCRAVLGAAGQGKAVAFTFDDGHATNLWAAQRLAARGWSADFFVNPSTVGTAHYLSWGQLREMAAMGMSIQSHGQHHRFLDELEPADVAMELSRSKQEIEAHIGQPVRVYAPAGGRMARGMESLARELGYEILCTSRAGAWRVADSTRYAVPRLAMLAGTPMSQFLSWIELRTGEMARQQLRYQLLSAAKGLLGNDGYRRLRSRLLGAGEGGHA
ncbi:MAG: polysaccharide deacetylase family protein [Aquabacterium sp.]|jgi:peptidoglycan/xylan/chitin deacetylase (PgdA/CDA1 family)|nr:MAG: polysaccharide deacetylase family protein [Aquabacterium sp.]